MQLSKASSQSSCTITSKPSSQSLLVLKRFSSKSKKNCLQFDFIAQEDYMKRSNWSVCEFLLVFNKDKKFYTPTFILKMDKEKYESRDQIYRSLHQERIQSNLTQETSDLRLPKPFKFNSYCTVCKREYLDYQKHIQSKSHTHKMLQSQFCQDIEGLCRYFGNPPCRKKGERKNLQKTKKISKTAKIGKMIQNVETKCEIESIN